jgi:uracil phosphoribosyltransferase
VGTHVVDHPLAADLLARLRDERTDRAAFRQAMDGLSGMLVYEACRHLESVDEVVQTPLGPAPSRRVATWPVVVPILRAGLGMMSAVHRLLPETDTAFIGVARDESTFAPEPYMLKVPADMNGRAVLVLDPMLATGGSLLHACGLLADRGAGPIVAVCVLAAPEGVAAVEAAGLGVTVVTAAIDDHLNDQAFIVPGLGDAGDRLFGTA